MEIRECEICFHGILSRRKGISTIVVIFFHLSCVIYIKNNTCPICKQPILGIHMILTLLKRFYLGIMSFPKMIKTRNTDTQIKELCEEIADITVYFKNNRTHLDMFLCGYFEKLVEIRRKDKIVFNFLSSLIREQLLSLRRARPPKI